MKNISYAVNVIGFFGYCFIMDYTINKRREDFFNKQNYLGNAYTVSTNKQTIGSTGETALIALSNPITNLSTNKQNGSLALFLGLRKYIQANNFTTASLFRIYSYKALSSM